MNLQISLPKMPPTPPNLPCLLILFLIVVQIVLSIETNQITFREAPQFYNSPHCPPPLPGGPSSVCSSSVAVHIAMTLDATYLRGSLAAIHSILRHSSCPQSIFFHFLTSNTTNSLSLSSTISSSFPSLPFAVYPFTDASRVSGLISTSIRGALDVPLNYARSYLPKIIPHCIPRIVYLDSDIIVVDDIHSLFTIAIPDSVALAAPEYCNANFTTYFTPSFWANSALSMTFAGRKACYFNTGVMVMELERWRQEGYTERIEEWMELQKRMRIYELGSLPPFLLVFAGRIAAVEHKWNQHGLGGDNYKGLCRDLHPGPVSLLHWSGKGKPWVRLDSGRPCPLDALWAPYDLMVRNPVVIEDS